MGSIGRSHLDLDNLLDAQIAHNLRHHTGPDNLPAQRVGKHGIEITREVSISPPRVAIGSRVRIVAVSRP